MLAFLLFGLPFILGAVLGGGFGRTWSRVYVLFALGLLLGFGFVAAAYLTAPPDYQHSNGTDGEEYLGRWWDPSWVVMLSALGYVTWFVGVGLGAGVRVLVTPMPSADPSSLPRRSGEAP